MKDYSSVTPTIQLMDNSFDLDQLSGGYVNMRFEVKLAALVTIDAKYQANLPGLAFDYYGDQRYWRAILAFNGLTDPLNDVTVGRTLGLPDATSLQAFLSQSKNGDTSSGTTLYV